MTLKSILTGLLLAGACVLPAAAETTYPLNLSNCGVDLSFDKAPAP